MQFMNMQMPNNAPQLGSQSMPLISKLQQSNVTAPVPQQQPILPNLCPILQPTVYSQVPQGPAPKYKVDVKRITYISCALEKKKTFFNGRKGSDPVRFLKYLEETARFMGLSEDEIFCCLPTVLTSEALEWFRLEEQHISGFEMFKKEFLNHYITRTGWWKS